MMKPGLPASLALFLMGCMMRDPAAIKTQVVTFPDGAIVEYNGTYIGRAPVELLLPQDSQGRLTGRAVIRALPNTEQHALYAQNRVLEPARRVVRVPNRIMIDMTLHETNATPGSIERSRPERLDARKKTSKTWMDRGKPTQPVGVDRWNPGHH